MKYSHLVPLIVVSLFTVTVSSIKAEAVVISGELKQWHQVTLTLTGPSASELDEDPNPFTDYAFDVTFTHESGTPEYRIPGYVAADGNAGETSANAGDQWRAHLSPDSTGTWNYEVLFR